MTLATRCPNCETVFKVVRDQLRVSEGWVRCGRCAEVFNAAQHLVDPNTGESRRAPIEVHSAFPEPAAVEPMLETAEQAGTAAAADAEDIGASGTAPDYGDDIEAELRERLAARERGASAPGSLDGLRGASAPGALDGLRVDPDEVRGSAGSTVERALLAQAAATPATGPDAAAEAEAPPHAVALPARERPVAGERRTTMPGELPSFVRAAERAQRWRRPGVRVLLAVGALLAGALLAAQWLYVYRDQAAARWPELRPLLAQACATLGCRVEAMRSIESLAVESSGLVRVEKSDVYRLSVALRNQREYEVALPAVDLSLTDTQGRLIARRVLRAAELGATAATLAASGELAMQATLQVAGTPVAGYTIELFYP